MSPERFAQLKELIEEQFGITQSGNFSWENRPGSVEFVEFSRPNFGDMRLEFTTHPRVIGRRAVGAKRVGAYIDEQVLYDEHEVVHTLVVFRMNADTGEWEEYQDFLKNI